MQGRIERLIHSHGFGFIHAEDGQEVAPTCSALTFIISKKGKPSSSFYPAKRRTFGEQSLCVVRLIGRCDWDDTTASHTARVKADLENHARPELPFPRYP